MFNKNQIKEGYGVDGLEWGDYPWKEDPHRCGSAPFVPQIMADGSQNSCGSYCAGFDKNGCNKYLNNYPDDYYLMDYSNKNGNCSDFKDCKRKEEPQECCPSHTNVIEYFHDFDMYPDNPFGIVMWLLLLFVIAKIMLRR